nr:MAG TPA: Pulmonary surfactant-associated protein D, c-type lectin, alpha-helical coiled [Caudoviricetes sp.]
MDNTKSIKPSFCQPRGWRSLRGSQGMRSPEGPAGRYPCGSIVSSFLKETPRS